MIADEDDPDSSAYERKQQRQELHVMRARLKGLLDASEEEKAITARTKALLEKAGASALVGPGVVL